MSDIERFKDRVADIKAIAMDVAAVHKGPWVQMLRMVGGVEPEIHWRDAAARPIA